MYVVQNGSRFWVAQLGADFLVLENACDIDGPAEIILSVDGVMRSRHVQLQRGTHAEEDDYHSIVSFTWKVAVIAIPQR